MTAPFAGLRVLDLSRGIAGPYATKLLCDQGACVLKVEERATPDPVRTRVAARGVVLAPGEDSALFRFLNAGKRAALCDSEQAQERAQLAALAQRADVLIESGAPDELARRVGDAPALLAKNPRLCIVSISPWGRRGPWAARPATEWTLQAATGFMARRGTPARGPVGAGGRIGDYAAGAFAAVAALASARAARASGRGRHVDLSLFEAMLICTTQYWDLNAQFLGGALLQYVDTPSIEPCADGWVGFATPTAQQWKDFCLLIERPELAEDARFRDANARMAHLDFVRDAIHAWTRTRTSAEILELCELLRIPCAPVLGGGALLEADHFRARGVFVQNPHGFDAPRAPFQLAGQARAEVRPAPRLGEHELAWPDATREPPRNTNPARANQVPHSASSAQTADPLRTAGSAQTAARAASHNADSAQRANPLRTAGSAQTAARAASHSASSAQTADPLRAAGSAQTAASPGSQASRPGEAGEAAGAQDEALRGLRVIDLTAFWAGPFATQVMALLGADVIKVESTKRPDGMRFVNAHPGAPLWEGGSIFHGANSDKRGITLQLDCDEGRALLRRLIERADLLIENFSVRVLGHFKLDWPTLQRWNPRLILLRMPAWGLDGPWCGRTGFAMNVEQASGLALRAGYDDQPLVAGLCDPLGSLHALTALFAALETRAASGRGVLVEAPLVETALNVAAEPIVEYGAYRAAPAPAGPRGPDCAPQGVYACANESWLALAVENDAQWRALAALFARARGVFEDAALEDARARHARHAELDRALAAACAGREAQALAKDLRAAGVPAEALVNGHFVMPNPQLEARNFYQTLEHHFTGAARYPGLPCTGLADARPRRAPPTLGQHNREVLGGELGLSDAALEALRQDGVLGERPAWET